MPQIEFAPEYSDSERVRFIVLSVTAGALIVAVCKLWFFPWLREFSASADCRSVLGISGTAVLFYGLFVGIPLHVALILAVLPGRRGYKILREGRTPPSGEKVFRPTKVERGPKAKLLGYVQLLSAAPMIALAVWGSEQAHSSVSQASHRPAKCAPNISLGADTQQQDAATRHMLRAGQLWR